MSFNDLPTESEPPRSFRRVGFLASGAFIVFVAFLGLVTALSSHGSTGRSTGAAVVDSSSAQSSAPASDPAAPATPAAGNGCGLTDTSQTVPTTTPSGVNWILFNGGAVPVSPAAGPGRVDGPVASCYAHTPLGALMAAAEIGTRLDATLNAQAAQIVEAQVMPGPGKQAFLAAAAGSAAIGDGKVDSQITGFQFDDYTPDSAVVTLVTQFTAGGYLSSTYTVDWSGGDWKLQLQPSGQETTSSADITNMTGFVPWSGIS
jgi:hypothetical protein